MKRIILLALCAFLQGCVTDGVSFGITVTLPTKQPTPQSVKVQK